MEHPRTPIGDFKSINNELREYDEFLAEKPQVVVLNKCDVSEVREMQDELLDELKKEAGHSRVLPISAATTENVKELMNRLKKFVLMQPKQIYHHLQRLISRSMLSTKT
jgi:GTP-binding protein